MLGVAVAPPCESGGRIFVPPPRRRRAPPGLRVKFNLALLPVLVAGMLAFVWLDYRHEVQAIMAAHALHVSAVGERAPSGPIAGATTPDAVGRRSLVLHAVLGMVTLTMVGLAINLALTWFVLRPLAAIETAIRQMEQGHWHVRVADPPGDELGRLTGSFRTLGLSLDAQMFQALYADRLALLALLSKRVASHLEPETHRLGRVIGQLAQVQGESARQARSDVADATATVLSVLRDLENLMQAGVQISQDAVARSRREIA